MDNYKRLLRDFVVGLGDYFPFVVSCLNFVFNKVGQDNWFLLFLLFLFTIFLDLPTAAKMLFAIVFLPSPVHLLPRILIQLARPLDSQKELAKMKVWK